MLVVLAICIPTTALVTPSYQADSNNSSDLIKEVTDYTVNNTISDYPFFVLDCYVPWCEPCIDMKAALHNLSSDLDGQVTFGMINVEENSRAAANYNITHFPTLLIFENGILVNTQIGYGSESELVESLKILKPDLNIGNTELNKPPQEAISPQGDIPLIEFGADKTSLPMRIDDDTLELALSKYPFFVLMGFADWCGYCKMMNSTIRELSSDLNGQVAFGLIDVEKNSITAHKYNIASYPSILIFKNGTLIRTQEGYRNTSEFLGLLKELEPSLDISNIKLTHAMPASQSKPGITKVIETLPSETDSTLKYLDRILNVTQADRASGVTINVFIINTCSQPIINDSGSR